MSSTARYENATLEPIGVPAPGYTRPDIAAAVFPDAYSPSIGVPSGRSTRACSSILSPPLVPMSEGRMVAA